MPLIPQSACFVLSGTIHLLENKQHILYLGSENVENIGLLSVEFLILMVTRILFVHALISRPIYKIDFCLNSDLLYTYSFTYLKMISDEMYMTMTLF